MDQAEKLCTTRKSEMVSVLKRETAIRYHLRFLLPSSPSLFKNLKMRHVRLHFRTACVEIRRCAVLPPFTSLRSVRAKMLNASLVTYFLHDFFQCSVKDGSKKLRSIRSSGFSGNMNPQPLSAQ